MGRAPLRILFWLESEMGTGKIWVRQSDSGQLPLRWRFTEKGDLVLFEPNPDKYVELARAPVLSAGVRAAPALAGGVLYARDKSNLVAFKVGP